VLSGGRVFVSAAPTAGARTWSAAPSGVPGVPGPVASLSCPSAQFCVAADGTGQVLTSPDPAAGRWTPTMLGAAPDCNKGDCHYDAITAVSCPLASFCASTDGSYLWTSTAPSAGRTGWRKSPLPAPVSELTCPSPTLCIAASGSELATTSDPADPRPTWAATGPSYPPPGIHLSGIACATIHTCVAVDQGEGYAISGDPAAAAGWTAAQIDPPSSFTPVLPNASSTLTAVACAPTGLCLATDGIGHVVAGQWSP
jgi:hypothetical protein